ncbi:MAG: neutral/alkaline non-lysosomal ceramidase N-terminal domain-containing protein [Kiritimatiellia bacterium]|nr:neutral/alkaline non-lysosomal ceramidase N-terminal domain-containing protein [Kiritimatiellia bacterium]
MKAGAGRIDITPSDPVWMDGMIRSHKSTGVRHRLYAKALALSSGDAPGDIFIIASVDVCGISRADHEQICSDITRQVGVPPVNIILAATHTHSGPATAGHFNQKEEQYTARLRTLIAEVAVKAIRDMRPALVGCGSGVENTISHYRRLLAKDGRVIMNWEPYTPDQIVGPLGEIDPEVGVLKAVSADADRKLLAVLFNHAGHPNVMSGDNYLLSAEYPGRAENILEQRLGGTAVFVNGAQGTMDIDGRKDRDWDGMERVAGALAEAVMQTSAAVAVKSDAIVRGASAHYTLPARRISSGDLEWAESILAKTKGKITPLPDGVGDDYKATLIKHLHTVQNIPHQLEQVGIVVGETAWLSFPGELFTEIGMRIKRASPFAHTYIIGLANGGFGYALTSKAIREGGYETDTRVVDESAEEIVFQQSTTLLKRLHAGK